MKKIYLKDCLKSVLIMSILSLPVSGIAQTVTYNFEDDVAGSNPPTGVTLVNGTAGVNYDATRTKTITPLAATAPSPATSNMDLFPLAKDYSVTWKETYTTAGATCFTLRGFGKYVAPNQYQGYGFQANAATGKLNILRFDTGGNATVKSVNLTAPGADVPRWYRATVDGALLTFEYSDDNVTFTTLISTIEDVYPSEGMTQLTRGYGSPIAGTYIDDVVFTPIITTSELYDFQSDQAGDMPYNITAANGTFTTNFDALRTNTLQVLTATSGDIASFNLNSFPSVSNYAIIWKENFSAAGRSGMILRASGVNGSNTGLKQGYLFEVSNTEDKLRISKSTATGFEMLNEFSLTGRAINNNRWYRAVTNGSDLTLEYSDNGRDFKSACATTDNTYTTGTTQFVQGFGTTLGNLFVDNIVYTPFGNGSLSVKNNELKNFTLYPNPASKTVNLLFDNSNVENTVLIYDIQGRLVKKIENKLENNASVDVSSLKKGIYFLKIKSGSAEQTKKLIIN